MTYDTWKTTEPEEFYPGPTKRQIGEKLADLEKEIAWLEPQLDILILSDEDREQTQDYLQELRDERDSLLWSFQWPVSGGMRR